MFVFGLTMLLPLFLRQIGLDGYAIKMNLITALERGRLEHSALDNRMRTGIELLLFGAAFAQRRLPFSTECCIVIPGCSHY